MGSSGSARSPRRSSSGFAREAKDAPRILLSPRGAERSAKLAGRYPSVEVAADNQAVVDGPTVVIAAVRPPDATAVLGALAFRADQALISVIAGISLGDLRTLAAPAAEVSRTIPLPAVARRAGVTAVYPPSAPARELFERLGGVSEFDDAAAFEVVTASTATFAAHYEYLAAIANWMTEHGLSETQARDYVTAMFTGLAQTLGNSGGDLEMLIRTHSTPGGLNERFAAMLRDGGALGLVEGSLDEIHAGLLSCEGA